MNLTRAHSSPPVSVHAAQSVTGSIVARLSGCGLARALAMATDNIILEEGAHRQEHTHKGTIWHSRTSKQYLSHTHATRALTQTTTRITSPPRPVRAAAFWRANVPPLAGSCCSSRRAPIRRRATEIAEYAIWLGMKLPEDEQFLSLAREGLMAPLPADWKPVQTVPANGSEPVIYYFNFSTGESTVRGLDVFARSCGHRPSDVLCVALGQCMCALRVCVRACTVFASRASLACLWFALGCAKQGIIRVTSITRNCSKQKSARGKARLNRIPAWQPRSPRPHGHRKPSLAAPH